jgi:beta-lactamase class D OXA-12
VLLAIALECFLVANASTGEIVRREGKCTQRLPPFSTFKLPLAVMGFDSGQLPATYKWDGTKRELPEWNRDTDERAWLKYSVVWYSQRLTPKIGAKRIDEYLAKFDYGNRDFSGGLTRAWLGSSLQISPEEQLAFLLRFQKLPVKREALEKTLAILPVEIDEPTLRIAGKTGSSGGPHGLGWYIGFARANGVAYAFVAQSHGDTPFFGRAVRDEAVDELRTYFGVPCH